MSSEKRVFVFIGEDNHIDVQVEVFTTFELAKAYCEEWLKDEDDVEESNIDGWLYHATYGCEGDSVRIESKTIDSKCQ